MLSATNMAGLMEGGIKRNAPHPQHKVLYRSGKPCLGASAFVTASSLAVVASPVWAPALLAWAGWRAVSPEARTHPADSNNSGKFLGVVGGALAGRRLRRRLFQLLEDLGFGTESTESTTPTIPRAGAVQGEHHEAEGKADAARAEGGEAQSEAQSEAQQLQQQRLQQQRLQQQRLRRLRRWGLFAFLAVLAYLPVKRWRRLHGARLWEKAWFGHLGVAAVGPPNHPALAARRQLLYAVVPHGIFPFGLGFATLGRLRDEVLRIGRVAVASATLRVPVLRHVIGWIGGIKADRASLEAALDAGETVALAPGGIAEMFWGFPRPGCGPDEEYALLSCRRGFVRLALEHGLPLVPVYVFGNTKLLKRVELPAWVERLSHALRMSLVLFWGRWGLPVPFQVPLLYAIGEPLNLLDTLVGGAPAAATDATKGPRRTMLAAAARRHRRHPRRRHPPPRRRPRELPRGRREGGWLGWLRAAGGLLPLSAPLSPAAPAAAWVDAPPPCVSEAEVDALHAAFCANLIALFDRHKADYGWAHKKLRVV